MRIKSHILLKYLALMVFFGPVVLSGAGKYSVILRMDWLSFYSDKSVTLKMYVKNISNDQQKFIIYDYDPYGNHYATFQPVVFDMSGNEAEIIVPYKLANMKAKDRVAQAEKRVIILGPNESFVYEMDLKKIYHLKPNTKYRVRGFFYPDVKKDFVIRSSDELSFNYIKVYDTKMASGITPDPVKQQIKKGISPSEIVLLLLNAEKTKKWKRFIKYIYLQKFINAYPEFVREYQLADPGEKLKKEQEFVIFLTRNRDDYILNYEIVKEQIEPGIRIAYVDVVVERYGAKISDRYKYRYTLEKVDGLWLIINLEATVLKGKRK